MKQRSRHLRLTPGGFSLVELLVVIGIIALLIALLMPTLSKSRREAQRVQCLANLRTVGQILVIYENNNRGWIYPVQEKSGSIVGFGTNEPPHLRWPMIAFKMSMPDPLPYDPDLYPTEPDKYDATPFTPKVLLCPSDPFAANAHSYVLNNHLAANQIKASNHNFAGKTASDVIVAGEKYSIANDYYMEDDDFDRVVEKYRHGLIGSNYLFFDMHAQTALPKDAQEGLDPWDVPEVAPPAG